MALITRISRLFKADMHAVLDQLEEPDILLQQAIREMEEEVLQLGRQLKAKEMEEASINSRISDLKASLTSLDGELDLCFAAENEVLTRTILRRKLETERLLKHLISQQQQAILEIAEGRAVLESQQQRLESMQQKAEVFTTLQEPVDKFIATGGNDFNVSEADIDIALLKARERWSKARKSVLDKGE